MGRRRYARGAACSRGNKRLHTGPEILSQIPGGTVDAVVSGVGTGGTLRGLYEAFAGAGCPVSAHAAIPRDLALFGANAECYSLRFSSDVPAWWKA